MKTSTGIRPSDGRFEESPRLQLTQARQLDDFMSLAKQWLRTPMARPEASELLASLMILDSVTHTEELEAAVEVLLHGRVELYESVASGILECQSIGTRRVVFHPYTAAVAERLQRRGDRDFLDEARKMLSHLSSHCCALTQDWDHHSQTTRWVVRLQEAAHIFWAHTLPGPLMGLQQGYCCGRTLTAGAFARLLTGKPSTRWEKDLPAIQIHLLGDASPTCQLAIELVRRVCRTNRKAKKQTLREKLLSAVKASELTKTKVGLIYVRFFELMEARQWARNTLITYFSCLKPYSSLVESAAAITSVSREEFKEFVIQDLLESSGGDLQAAIRTLVPLNHFLKAAELPLRIQIDESKFHPSQVLIEIPTAEDIRRMKCHLEKMQGDPELKELCLQALWLLKKCVFRRSEIAALRLGDVNVIGTPYLVVSPSASSGLKSAAAERVIALEESPETDEFIAFIRRRHFPCDADPQSLLFSRKAAPKEGIYFSLIAPALTKALQAATGVETIGLHSFRMRAASDAYCYALTEERDGASTRLPTWDIADRLGHADPIITISNYVAGLELARASVTEKILREQGLVLTCAKLTPMAVISVVALKKRQHREQEEAFNRARLPEILGTPTFINLVLLSELVQAPPGNAHRRSSPKISSQRPPTFSESLEIAAAIAAGHLPDKTLAMYPWLKKTASQLDRTLSILQFAPPTSKEIKQFGPEDILALPEVAASQKIHVQQGDLEAWVRALRPLHLSLSSPWRARELQDLERLGRHLIFPSALGLYSILKIFEDHALSDRAPWIDTFSQVERVPRRQLGREHCGAVYFSRTLERSGSRRRTTPHCQLSVATITIASLYAQFCGTSQI